MGSSPVEAHDLSYSKGSAEDLGLQRIPKPGPGNSGTVIGSKRKMARIIAV